MGPQLTPKDRLNEDKNEDEPQLSIMRSAVVSLGACLFSGSESRTLPPGARPLAPRRVESAIVRQGGRKGRGPLHPGLPAQELVHGDCAHDRSRRLDRA